MRAIRMRREGREDGRHQPSGWKLSRQPRRSSILFQTRWGQDCVVGNHPMKDGVRPGLIAEAKASFAKKIGLRLRRPLGVLNLSLPPVVVGGRGCCSTTAAGIHDDA